MLNVVLKQRYAPAFHRALSNSLAGDSVRVASAQLVTRGGFALVTFAAARLLPVPEFTDYTLFLVNSALVASVTSLG